MPRLNRMTATAQVEAQMVWVEGGTFQMGGTVRDRAQPIHAVRLSDFYLSQHLVSQALWEEVMGTNPARFRHPHRPVEGVSWYEAIEFCNRLSKKQGLAPCYDIDKHQPDPNNENESDDQRWTLRPRRGAKGYRLPTEAEWEYAARGGKYRRELPYAGSPNPKEIAWGKFNSQGMSQAPGLKRPNALGLYDLSGNLWEWCWDWFSETYYQDCAKRGTVKNPFGSQKGSRRVVRGGSWNYYNDDLFRVASRDFFIPFFRDDILGFRVSRYR